MDENTPPAGISHELCVSTKRRLPVATTPLTDITNKLTSPSKLKPKHEPTVKPKITSQHIKPSSISVSSQSPPTSAIGLIAKGQDITKGKDKQPELIKQQAEEGISPPKSRKEPPADAVFNDKIKIRLVKADAVKKYPSKIPHALVYIF
eukprot:TRINITY_DN8081_c0_g1_i1.p1 TRINITY_DN8081_c0_g1~~TRINITY_DN8081_c0_g1_i1.p1  ORF type:complete len:149 (-),score=31.14 TRINITY_DN8081_c0_g1_i1:93-539(-)